ncbi:Protein FAM24A [Manis javanica]|nr:Protein FAM24A [Manis javanica]
MVSNRSGWFNCLCEMFGLKIMFAIGGCLLMATFVLICVVICLYCKLTNTLNAAVAVTREESAKLTEATASTPGSHPYQYCEECSLYANLDSLPPCFCYVNEGP